MMDIVDFHAHAFPDAIAAHLGAWKDWENVVRYLAGRPIWLDTSFSLQYLSADAVGAILETFTAKRLLFGSDSPWDDQAASLRRVRELKKLGLNQDDIDSILDGNARRLLGIERPND